MSILRQDLIETMQEEVYLNLVMGVVHRRDGNYILDVPDFTEEFDSSVKLAEFFAEQLSYMYDLVSTEYGEDIAEVVCDG